MIDEDYYIYLAVWLAAPVLLFAFQARGGRQPGFLVFSYCFGFFMSHWFGALAHASPWAQFPQSVSTVIGFAYSTWALMALAAGSMLMDMMKSTRPLRRPPEPVRRAWLERAATVARTGLAPAGVMSWVLSLTPVGTLPSMGAVLSVGKQSLLLALCLLCWVSWETGQRGRFWSLVGLAMVFPVITVSLSGFIGYGIVMTTTILAFIAMFYRPRWHLLIGLTVMIVAGVSLWVSYAQRRDEIREAAWGEQDSGKTLEKFIDVIANIEPIDLSNLKHLETLDTRLNQNHLIGVAVVVTPDYVPFRYGETLILAAVSFIPRVIWPDKPEVGGSGNLVSEHTMIKFAQGTSVGMGQVFEFYINFGLPGILIGFVLLGAVLRYGDIVLVEAMAGADWQVIAKVFLVGSGLLQSGGSMMEVVASCMTGYVLSVAIDMALGRKRRRASLARARR